MRKLKMHTPDLTEEKFKKLAELFPNAVTETVDENGKIVRAIDADILRQEISVSVVEGAKERYQFTWPDKKKSVILSNQPIASTLRLDRKKSVGRDGKVGSIDTENIYIEGDNLEVLKLLQETYLGKIKMIYIDPPYNTGSDAFVYDDDSSISAEEFAERSGQRDEEGNLLFDFRQNNEANGRFHTDWLNMMYPRLRLAKDLLSDDGVIFISIDDHEQTKLRCICDEIFGSGNFIAQILIKRQGGRQDSKYYAVVHEYCVCYAKKAALFKAGMDIKEGDNYTKFDEKRNRFYKTQLLRKWGANSLRENRPNLYYPIIAPDGSKVYPTIYQRDANEALVEIESCWRWQPATMKTAIRDGRVEFIRDDHNNWIPYEKLFAPEDGEVETKKFTTWQEDTGNGAKALKQLFGDSPFDYPKSVELIKLIIKMANCGENAIVLDFFSGSSTTAHAVMQLNAEDGGNRRFIMIQLQEKCDESSVAYREGYKNICEIGEERIRRAGKEIKEKSSLSTEDLDIGFRVFYLDNSNMENVYYSPAEVKQQQIESYSDNIKADRTPEDLLFQVMLDYGIPLSAKIEKKKIAGKTVFAVDGVRLIACFDSEITEKTITAIAKQKPDYAAFRDSGMANDSVMTNFEQIFKAYSSKTVRKVL